MLLCLYCGKESSRQSSLTRHIESKHDTVEVPVTINFDQNAPPLGRVRLSRKMAEAYMDGKVAFTPAVVTQGDNRALAAIGMTLVIEVPNEELIATGSGLQFEPVPIKPAGL